MTTIPVQPVIKINRYNIEDLLFKFLIRGLTIDKLQVNQKILNTN